MSSRNDESPDPVKSALSRSRLIAFLGEGPKVIEGLTDGEIRAAIKGAVRAVREFLEVDDGALN